MIQNFKLVEKKKLTHNVFELIFEAEKSFDFIAGQFITFLIEVWWRAYSILEENGKNIKLIIKKREINEWWRWWSIYLCDLGIWEIIKWVWPAGHFQLKENNKNKLFFWTWTWFVPLYNQIITWLEKKYDCNFKLIFWARENKDLFYIKELEKLKEKYDNFDFEVYISREESEKYKKWYVTDFLENDKVNNFEEIYICGAHAMIDSVKGKSLEKWFLEENIFTEKY